MNLQTGLAGLVTSILPFLLTGCGTSLDAKEANRRVDAPEGIPINQRRAYTVTARVKLPARLYPEYLKVDKPALARLDGVDFTKVLDLDICRMPFADGKLVLELDERQTFKVLTITGEAGAPRVLQAGQAGVEDRNNFVKARQAKEDADEAD